MNQMSTITLCSGKFLALVREGRWEYVDRIGATGAVWLYACRMCRIAVFSRQRN